MTPTLRPPTLLDNLLFAVELTVLWLFIFSPLLALLTLAALVWWLLS